MRTISLPSGERAGATAPLRRQRLAETAVTREGAAVVVALLRDAGNPYCDWFFDGADEARAALASALERPSSEFAAERVSALLDADGVVGISLALSGAELVQCRRADMVAAVADGRMPRSALMRRIAESRELFLPVEATDLYISRLAVVRGLRGHGLGRVLLDDCVAAGRAAGFTRFSLDVAAENERALRLYRAFGFAIEDAREAAGMRYLRMTLVDE